MYDLFVSYATSDGREIAKAVSEHFRKRFLLTSFVAELAPITHDSVDQKIREALSASRRVLVIFTSNAAASPWVSGEIVMASEMGKDLIVCRHAGVERRNLPVRLQSMQDIAFTDADSLLRELTDKVEWGIPLVIPAAGRSGGLHPLTMGMPKILLPVGDRPILHHIIDRANKAPGVFSKIIVITGKKNFGMIEHYAGLKPSEITVECQKTSHDLLPLALKNFSFQTTFMIHYSDILIEGDFDWKDFLAQHKNFRRRFNAIGTLMTSSNYKLPVGRIRADGKGVLTEFREKPENIQAVGYTINMAVSIFEPKFLEYVGEEDQSLYGHTLGRAMESSEKFCIYEHDNWRHVQTLSDWYEAQKDYLRT